MKASIQSLIHCLEAWAPPSLQESYDNSGLLTGNPNDTLTGVLICLDCTEAVVEEAVSKGCNVIIAHHPIVFSGLKRLTGRSYIERTVIAAIRNQVAIYAIHTNLDNIQTGVNARIGRMLGIAQPRILKPLKGQLLQLTVYVPHAHAENVRSAMFEAGAGHIGAYSHCSFNMQGDGTFRAGEGAQPFVGEMHQTHTEAETRIECLVPVYKQAAVWAAMKKVHPYEEIAHQWVKIENAHQELGAGMIGRLDEPMEAMDFLMKIKAIFGGTVRYTALPERQVEHVAWCGGSGSFLLSDARAAKADVFISSDFKYHQFFDAEGQILIADIGHFENEQFTMQLIYDYLKENFPNFAGCITTVQTNPIHYL